jgi:hypothetical protein
LKLAVVLLTVVAVPLEVGLVPSVVYVMLFTPDAPLSPAAEMATATGEAEYQPALQAAVLQSTELVGALPSASAVNVVPVLERFAPFCAVTSPDWVAEPLVNE